MFITWAEFWTYIINQILLNGYADAKEMLQCKFGGKTLENYQNELDLIEIYMRRICGDELVDSMKCDSQDYLIDKIELGFE